MSIFLLHVSCFSCGSAIVKISLSHIITLFFSKQKVLEKMTLQGITLEFDAVRLLLKNAGVPSADDLSNEELILNLRSLNDDSGKTPSLQFYFQTFLSTFL